mmetsp:Transcript_1375/g.3259  ORF Transcript_1375/g.3259 Transcript_1375/m.3259 type:complete len:317 (+) Transcript_1375:440-1390(+)
MVSAPSTGRRSCWTPPTPSSTASSAPAATSSRRKSTAGQSGSLCCGMSACALRSMRRCSRSAQSRWRHAARRSTAARTARRRARVRRSSGARRTSSRASWSRSPRCCTRLACWAGCRPSRLCRRASASRARLAGSERRAAAWWPTTAPRCRRTGAWCGRPCRWWRRRRCRPPARGACSACAPRRPLSAWPHTWRPSGRMAATRALPIGRRRPTRWRPCLPTSWATWTGRAWRQRSWSGSRRPRLCRWPTPRTWRARRSCTAGCAPRCRPLPLRCPPPSSRTSRCCSSWAPRGSPRRATWWRCSWRRAPRSPGGRST